MNVINFQTEVLEKSREIPVVVDFWAPWCGPCRVLGPVIEQLAAEQAGRWVLAKVNTEEMPEIAQAYQVMSIPNVKLFRDGKPVAEFTGALPRRSIEKWLEENIPSDVQVQLEDILSDGSPNMRPRLESFLAQHPGEEAARLALAKLVIFAEPRQALEWVSTIQLGSPYFDGAEDVRTLSAFLADPIPSHTPAGIALEETRTLLLDGKYPQALNRVVDAVQADKSYLDQLPRRLGIALFRFFGEQHPLVREVRWRFDMALY